MSSEVEAGVEASPVEEEGEAGEEEEGEAGEEVASVVSDDSDDGEEM